MKTPPLFLLLAPIASISPAAFADDTIERVRTEGDAEHFYLDDGNHVRLGLDFGFGSLEDSSILGMQPTLEGRFALDKDMGIQIVLPMSFVQLTPKTGESESRFDLGNPSVAFEYLFDNNGHGVKFARAGVTLPLFQAPDEVDAANFVDALLSPYNSGMAGLAHGHLDYARFGLEMLTVFAEIEAQAHFESLYFDLEAGLGLAIPTMDKGEVGFLAQASARFGYGDTFIPFLGLGLGLIPSERASSLNETSEDDALQFSVQAGTIANYGNYKFDLALHLNIDGPGGFSLSDQGVLGLQVGGTASF